MKVLTQQFVSAPPLIQETVAGATTESITLGCQTRIYTQLSKRLPDLVSDILEDSIRLRTRDGDYRVGYECTHIGVDPEIVACARTIVDQIMLQYGDELMENRFQVPGPYVPMDSDSDLDGQEWEYGEEPFI